jgi:hypothetical protein
VNTEIAKVYLTVRGLGCMMPAAAGVQDIAAGRQVSGRRQGEASGCNLAGNKTLVVEFQNGQDDTS